MVVAPVSLPASTTVMGPSTAVFTLVGKEVLVPVVEATLLLPAEAEFPDPPLLANASASESRRPWGSAGKERKQTCYTCMLLIFYTEEDANEELLPWRDSAVQASSRRRRAPTTAPSKVEFFMSEKFRRNELDKDANEVRI